MEYFVKVIGIPKIQERSDHFMVILSLLLIKQISFPVIPIKFILGSQKAKARVVSLLLQENFHLVFLFLFRDHKTKEKGLFVKPSFPESLLAGRPSLSAINWPPSPCVWGPMHGFSSLDCSCKSSFIGFRSVSLPDASSSLTSFLRFIFLQISQICNYYIGLKGDDKCKKLEKAPPAFWDRQGQNKITGLIPQNRAVFQIFNKSVLAITVAFNVWEAQGKLLFSSP